MDQDQWIVLCLKIGLASGFIALIGWVAVYHVVTGGRWRKNPIGRTLVVKSLLIAGLFIPTSLSLFFNLSRLDSRIAGWSDVVLIGAVAPVMLWRTILFIRLRRLGEFLGNAQESEGEPPDGTG